MGRWETIYSARGSKLDQRAGELFDFVASHKHGVTYELVHDKLGWDRHKLFAAARRVRRILAGEKITLSCCPRGAGQTWLYQLTGDYDEIAPWQHNRIHDCESRLETIENVARSIVLATDARTVEGRKSRLMVKVIHRLREDIGDINMAANGG